MALRSSTRRRTVMPSIASGAIDAAREHRVGDHDEVDLPQRLWTGRWRGSGQRSRCPAPSYTSLCRAATANPRTLRNTGASSANVTGRAGPLTLCSMKRSTRVVLVVVLLVEVVAVQRPDDLVAEVVESAPRGGTSDRPDRSSPRRSERSVNPGATSSREAFAASIPPEGPARSPPTCRLPSIRRVRRLPQDARASVIRTADSVGVTSDSPPQTSNETGPGIPHVFVPRLLGGRSPTRHASFPGGAPRPQPVPPIDAATPGPSPHQSHPRCGDAPRRPTSPTH